MIKGCRVTVRAFNAEGYHKDILLADDRQVRMNDTRLKEAFESGRCGMMIVPKDFPEMTRFQVIIEPIE